jgi:hypothetical protein
MKIRLDSPSLHLLMWLYRYTDPAPDQVYNLERWTNHLLSFMQAVGIKRAHLPYDEQSSQTNAEPAGDESVCIGQEEDTSASLQFSILMRAFPGASRCGGIFRHLFETLGKFVHECSQSEGEFTTSGLEMLLWLSWQPIDRQKRYTYSRSHHTSDEALSGSLAFLGFSIHTSFLSFLLILTVYHTLTSLFVTLTDTCHYESMLSPTDYRAPGIAAGTRTSRKEPGSSLSQAFSR